LLHELGARVVATRIAGGEWLGNVPNRCVVACHAVVAHPDTLHTARRAIEQAVDAAAREDPWLASRPPRVRWGGAGLEPFAGDPGSELVRLVLRCHGAAAGTEARPSITRAGVPLAAAAALAEQTVAIRWDAPSGVGASRVLAATALEWCGRAG
jgi:acetylornithine deacetylase